MGATAVLSEFIAGTSYERLPAEVVEAARIAILDGVANLLAGSAQPAGRIIGPYIQELGGRPDCSVVGWNYRTSPPQAAFANGVFLHCLDFEIQGYPGAHGTSAILPPALAIAEQQGLSGKDVISAYVVGWDVQARLRNAAPRTAGSPFHPPGIFGPIAAAASSANVLGLDAAQTATALGIAGSRTGGLYANSGTMVKSTHPANAGRHGLEAALLARAGFISNDEILEAEGGYVETLWGGTFNWDLLTADLGQRFYLIDPGFHVKRYPSQIFLQWAIDAVVGLREKYNLQPEDVEWLELEVSERHAALSRPEPKSGLEGEFSFQYCAAVALTQGTIGIDTFSDETRFSPPVEAAMPRIRVRPNPEIKADLLQTWVGARARLKDGREVAERCRHYRGSMANPMTRDERLAKVRSSALRVLGPAETERVIAMVEAFDELADVRDLMGLLRVPASVTR
jgi:2-methylcitrate dehydratase PrpD